MSLLSKTVAKCVPVLAAMMLGLLCQKIIRSGASLMAMTVWRQGLRLPRKDRLEQLSEFTIRVVRCMSSKCYPKGKIRRFFEEYSNLDLIYNTYPRCLAMAGTYNRRARRYRTLFNVPSLICHFYCDIFIISLLYVVGNITFSS